MNDTSVFAAGKYQSTVSGLFYCLDTKSQPLIGIHWGSSTAKVREFNRHPLASEWKQGESAEAAMARQVAAEYDQSRQFEITPLSHSAFTSNATGKQYYWLLVHLLCEPGEMMPQSKSRDAFDWYGPRQLQYGISSMHEQKQRWFKEILRLAIQLEPNLATFRKQFG